MAFESLTERFQNIFNNLRGKAKLDAEDVHTAMKEVKLALLEADVNFKVVKDFVKETKAKAIGAEVFESLSPGQTVIRIVRDELIHLMGDTAAELELKPQNQVTVIMMAGLQGAGKTTTAAKLGGIYKSKGRRVLLAACDVYRPAAIDQLKTNGEKLGVEVFSMGTGISPVEIAKSAYDKAVSDKYSILIIDTAGRLHIDENMMQELKDIKAVVNVDYTLLTVDAMTGQDAVTVAEEFSEKVGVDGLIVTKLDGDTKGGAALSIRAVTGKPIYFAGMGEKLTDLQVFYPDRMASRIIGMGDILSLIEKAEETVDLEKQKKVTEHLRKSQFTYDDFLTQMEQMRKMGGISGILSMLPGMKGFDADQIDQSQFTRIESMILSMTREERANPKLMSPSRKRRIAAGSGTDIADVNRMVKQFEQMQKFMKQMNGMKKHGNLNSLFGRNLFRGKGLF